MHPSPLLIAFCVALPALAGMGCAESAARRDTAMPEPRIQVVVKDANARVDVLVDGALFTSYLFADSLVALKKPVLYPIRTATGKDITRGYPFEARAGERVDHPHHIGHWLNYGDVNGFDFWNNSDAIPPERRPHMGEIRHRSIREIQSGDEEGLLEVEADWVTSDGVRLLTERTRFIFRGDAASRTIDRVTTLTSGDQQVVFTDNKEGMIALRVTRALEHAEGKPVLLTDAAGQPMAEPVLDDSGVTGQYVSSAGLTGVEVWGTRAEWMILKGTLAGESVSVALLDHPQNPGFPTYWHARGYGLFAANPLGQKAMSSGKDELNYTLAPGASVTFRYRILVLSDPTDPVASVRAEATAFTTQP